MIIFDLDGTLADCEHRRHFVDPRKDQSHKGFVKKKTCDCEFPHESDPWIHKETGAKWKPDWDAFYDNCDKDIVILPTLVVIRCMLGRDYYDNDEDVHIWSARCESVRQKTEKWLDYHSITYNSLKMRPFKNSTPDDILKENWLDEAIASKKKIDFVFDDRPKVIDMWRRRGIFVFKCSQNDEDF